jgi:hypothetical protein
MLLISSIPIPKNIERRSLSKTTQLLTESPLLSDVEMQHYVSRSGWLSPGCREKGSR